MRKTLITGMLSVSALSAFCQQDSLLKKFKYRISNYRAIGLTISGGSQFYQTKPVAGTNKNSSASGNFGGSYYTLKSTDKILLTTSAGLYASFFRAKSDNQQDVSTSRSFSTTPYFAALNKWFGKNIFTELGATISGNFSTGKNVALNTPDIGKNKQAQYSITINTGIGKGRLENVTDMQNALWLYKELQSVKSITTNLSADELNELGMAITKGNNTRVLDARKRVQFLLGTVDNYFQQKGLINKTDITYFSSLNDILFFAFNNPRLAGTEKFIRFAPAITGWNNDQSQTNPDNKFEYRFSTQSATVSAGFGKYIPANIVHQNNYGASVKLSFIATDLTERFFNNGVVTNEAKGKTDIKQAGVNLFYQHAIYPNTRTTISIGLQSEMGYQEADTQKGFYGSANLSGNVNYYISYRTRLTCNAGASYQKNNYAIYQDVALLPNTIQLYANAGVEINL